MTLNIDDPETDQLVDRLTSLTGESAADAVKRAVRQLLDREQQSRKMSVDEAMAIARRMAARIQRDGRTAEEIIGYDGHGLPM